MINNLLNETRLAEKRIRPYILKTPLIESKELSNLIQGKVFLKLENEQHTGSFKARGALNKLLYLKEKNSNVSTITASTGNHGLGYARAIEITKQQGTIYLPNNASSTKIKALKQYPVSLEFFGSDCLTTELFAQEQAKKQNKIYISPYNDTQVIAGQGTIGIELIEQLEHFDSVLITIGGGGLISGIGSYLKSKTKQTKVIGCEPLNSPEMSLSLKAGKIYVFEEELDTLSDASAGGIEENSITFPICQSVIDTNILISEAEIKEAIKFMAHNHRKIVEGAAGVAIASLTTNKEMFIGQTVVIVVCGGNIDIKKFKEII